LWPASDDFSTGRRRAGTVVVCGCTGREKKSCFAPLENCWQAIFPSGSDDPGAPPPERFNEVRNCWKQLGIRFGGVTSWEWRRHGGGVLWSIPWPNWRRSRLAERGVVAEAWVHRGGNNTSSRISPAFL